MKVGVVTPQGWVDEYSGWNPTRAWDRMLAVAAQIEDLGFESVWLFDHLHTKAVEPAEMMFESFTTLSALAMATRRVRLGQLVLCAGYRNAALTAKMMATLDVISGGRVELAVGAGWKEDEWRAYGFGFPPLKARLNMLHDYLEIVSRVLADDRSTFAGESAGIAHAINLPRGLQRPRVPLIVGGNGPNVTWRLAAAYADELNLDYLEPSEVAAAIPVIRGRCEEIGRDPDTLRVSLHLRWDRARAVGQQRVDDLGTLRSLGLARVQIFDPAVTIDDETLPRLADDSRAAGLELGAHDQTPPGGHV